MKYEIISKDYAKEIISQTNDDNSVSAVEGDYIKNAEGKNVKTVLMVKFTKDDGTESAVQRYEVDGDDEEMIAEQLQKSLEEYNSRIV